MCPNFTSVFTLCLNIFMIFIWDMKQTDVGVGCNFEVITFDYIYDVGVGCNFEVITFEYIYSCF